MTGTASPTRPKRRARLNPGPARVSPVWTVLRLLGGWVTVAALAYLLWTWPPADWSMRLLFWVGLTILADEFGGWFGYLGAVLGGLPFFVPELLTPQWTVIVPLVGGALLALLLVKHSGGAFVLPFAAAVFALPLLAVGRYGTKLDPELTLPGNATFQRTALTAMLAALAFSFVRQLVGVAWRYAARRRARRAALAAAPAPVLPVAAAPAPAPTAPTAATQVITATAAPEEGQVGLPSSHRESGRHG
ncbi:hypothetical protein DAETH_14920 [Deinococcus aetherius]|uniref:Uncharacterized protein n=1 Tax=Deinococcus aetherius TaxID=200252 RepID=A0ABM8ACS8_9DEIO|nr:hypothetical protein [Deinococcus aetherius]BDP41523.1 hypothetical protein DAETH_14920 [Deinococcus aetherius]